VLDLRAICGATHLGGPLAARVQRGSEHRLSGLVHAVDLGLQHPRALDLGARSPAGLEIAAHDHQRLTETSLGAQQERAEIVGQGARDPARHAGPQHLVQLGALLVRCQTQRRDTVLEERPEILFCAAESGESPGRARDAVVELRHLGDLLASSSGEQQDVLQLELGTEIGDHERRQLDARFALPHQLYTRQKARMSLARELEDRV